MNEQEKFAYWYGQKDLDPTVRQMLDNIKNDPEEIFDSFYRDLEFGTAGLRGVLGAGTNRMNVYTVGQASEGFARYLEDNFKDPSIAIAYDSRHNSDVFALLSARIMAKHGIKVYLYGELMPTPMLSYAVRYYHCDGGIVVTASHNPAKYNGYKVYGPDGCQAGPEMADAILDYITKADMFAVSAAPEDDAHIEIIPEETICSFLDTVLSKRVCVDPSAVKDLKLIYTPLNGTGRMPVLRLLDTMGVGQVKIVKEQEFPDGDFPTCPYPNPEMREALELGLKMFEKEGGDLLIATDPDADRVGAAVNQHGEYVLISGNEMGVLMLDYICRVRREDGTMPEKPVAVKTIVTTAMVDDVADHYGVKLESVLTGFKFIGGVIADLEAQGRENDYLLGFEESYGYLMSGHVRDKDSISAVMLVCDMAAYYKKQGKTLVDVLNELFAQYGYYYNKTVSVAFEGASGMEKMAGIMDNVRNHPLKTLAGADVVEISDYKLSVTKNREGEKEILLPKSNVLGYKLSDGCSFLIRPSGTEPKLKFYMFAKASSSEAAAKRVEELCAGLMELTK